MRDLVIVFGSSSSSAITNPHHRNNHHRYRPAASSEPSRNTKSSSSLAKSPPSLPQHHSAVPPPAPVSAACARSLRISTTVEWNPDGSVEYYAELASKLAEDGRLQDVALIAETVGAVSGANVSRFASMLDFDLLARGIWLNLQQGKIECVIQTLPKLETVGIPPLDLIDESSVKLMRKLFRGMVNSGEVEKFVGLVEILAGFQFKIKELVDPFDIVNICVDNSDPDLAIRYSCLLPHSEILFCRIIHGFGKKGDMGSVMATYEACKQILVTPNMYIYRSMIDASGLCGDYMKSRYIYEDLLKQNVKPNIYVLNSLMNVNSNDIGYTLEIYKNMQKLNVAADMASYNILLKACCLAGRVDLAQDIYKEAKRMESSGVLKLDSFTYCTIIKVFADAKLWKMALKVKEDMQCAGVKPNTHTWSSLISACANAGLVEQANHLFEEMLAAGCEPNSQCFNILLHACVEAHQYDRAFRLFQLWKGSPDEEALHSDDIVSNGGVSDLKKMNRHGISVVNRKSGLPYTRCSKRFFFKPTTATYNILLKACGTDYYRGKELMGEMKSLGLAPNLITWSTLINMCGGSGDVEGAIQILRTMHAAGIKPDVVAYTTAIKVCVESKKLKLAFSLFEEMRRYQIKPNLVTYNTLLRARSKYGSLHEVRQCLAIYQDMRKAGYKPNDYFLKELIEEWCEGVIQEDSYNQDKTINQRQTNLGRPVSLLIERLSVHLQERTAGNLAIDLQGLTEVEARIVVLAVLRMIKEDFMRGDGVIDDVLIILGTAEAISDSGKQERVVKDALIKLLNSELALKVVPAGRKHARETGFDAKSSDDSDQFSDLENDKPREVASSTRRPAILQRLLVTKQSLHQWLQRKSSRS
ncbi:PREDICTED: pentatricopeptide repeat-containing protein At5g02830, chloroplastic isoform X2 [Tarenaya hassleriana]|uniref:pentatricopeptide repeat-containing protein At5g02830, chloroplastic isoform X2 n=1 Tax=Tarenaya hassleriana TaxID=28532 RepID=UPI00053C4824|nr:PREDICTED: pentatricopeptide repeat-containing protein At5g02830, chloroplastic isoform X2 [Tarenaya hassleriana]